MCEGCDKRASGELSGLYLADCPQCKADALALADSLEVARHVAHLGRINVSGLRRQYIDALPERLVAAVKAGYLAEWERRQKR